MRSESSVVDLDLARVRLREAGTGRWTVVTAPDPPNVLEHEEPLFEELASHARLVAYELPGFGHSRLEPGGDPSSDPQVQTLIELLETRVEGPCALALPCIAGLVAHRVAVERPELVDALVLIQTPDWAEADRWARRIDPMGLLHVPYVGQFVNRLGRRWLARSWYDQAVGPAVATEPYVEQAEAAFDAGARFPLARAFQNIHRRADEVVPRTDRPTLAVWGGADESHRSDAHASSDRLLDGGAPSQRVVMEDVGHFPELEAPDRFSRALLSFLESV